MPTSPPRSPFSGSFAGPGGPSRSTTTTARATSREGATDLEALRAAWSQADTLAQITSNRNRGREALANARRELGNLRAMLRDWRAEEIAGGYSLAQGHVTPARAALWDQAGVPNPETVHEARDLRAALEDARSAQRELGEVRTERDEALEELSAEQDEVLRLKRRVNRLLRGRAEAARHRERQRLAGLRGPEHVEALGDLGRAVSTRLTFNDLKVALNECCDESSSAQDRLNGLMAMFCGYSSREEDGTLTESDLGFDPEEFRCWARGRALRKLEGS